MAELFSESEKVFRLMRYSNIVEFDHKTVVPPPFNLIEFIVRIGFNIYHEIKFFSFKINNCEK